MGDYIRRLPKELRGELIQVLRGRELLEYCKKYECEIAWPAKLRRDYGVTEEIVSMADYMAFVVAEEVGLPIQEDLSYMAEELETAAMKLNLKVIEYFLFDAEPWIAARLFVILRQPLYNYLWDTYPALRQTLVLSALAFDESLLHPPRIMDVPIGVLIEWIPYLRRAYDHQEEILEKLQDVVVMFREHRLYET